MPQIPAASSLEGAAERTLQQFSLFYRPSRRLPQGSQASLNSHHHARHHALSENEGSRLLQFLNVQIVGSHEELKAQFRWEAARCHVSLRARAI